MPLKKSESEPFAVSGLAAAHPELHHYTTFAGLKGIVESNTLWATHFLDLNDSREVFLLEEPLTEVLSKLFNELLRTRQRDSLRLRQIISKRGGLRKNAYRTAKDFVETLYETTFRATTSQPFVEAYITSFCSHAPDQPYERENGLLSQWRGYGRDGGFCIVFDTAALRELLRKEYDAYYYIHMNIGTVHYAVPSVPIDTVFPDLSKVCALFLEGMLDQNPEPPLTILPTFVSGATRFKHEGFKEEREVRIVSIPGSQKVYFELKRQFADELQPQPIKPIIKSDRRRIVLLENLGLTLPINRVIVGPSRHQHENFDRARELLGPHIPLHSSETPFIG